VAQRPVIAITGPAKGAFGPRSLVALAVCLSGGTPLQLRPGDDISSKNFDGVVVTGGHDVEPVLYAAEPEVTPNYDQQRDKLELAVIEQALTQQLPLLGICRGAQLLNVYLGGSLHQQLISQRLKTSARWTILPVKTLCPEPEASLLSQIIGTQQRRINSLHNQAINKLGKGVVITARDLDGIVQAIEQPEADFVIGVQWHPEFLLYLPAQFSLFSQLVKAARAKLNRPD
jgi:putative glutamine amidotransferase